MGLEQDVEDGTGLVDGHPELVLLSTDLNVHFVQKPSRTPAGFAVAQFFGQERRKFDVPLPQCFVADLDATLVKQFLDVTLAEEEAVVQPERVSNHAEGKTVA